MMRSLLLLLLFAASVYARPVDVTLHDAESGATANGTAPVVLGADMIVVQIVGAGGWDGTANWETTADGTNYLATSCLNVSTLALATTATADGIYRCTLGPVRRFRARISGRTAGSVTMSAIYDRSGGGGGGVATGWAGETLTITTQDDLCLQDAAGGDQYCLESEATAPSGTTTLTLNIDPSTCHTDGNAGTLTVNASNEIICAADDGGAGGSGDSVRIEQGDDGGGFDAIDTTASFEDQGDINFIFADGGAGGPDTVTAEVRADKVDFDNIVQNNTLAGDPALAVDECFLVATTTGGGFICEGSTADTNEMLHLFPDENEADTTRRIVLDTATQTLTNKTLNTASNTITINAADISDQDAGTDITADLEEETHASEHESGGSDTVDHDNLTNFVAGEHVNHAAVNIDTASPAMTGGGSIGATRTLDFDYTSTLAGNPAMAQDECIFSTDGTGGGLLCEGAADTVEGLLVWNPATADRTLTLPDATDTLVARDTTDTLTNKTINTASNTITVVEADISDLSHTTDTGPSPDCTGTDQYQDGDGGCDTVGGDMSGALDVLAYTADSIEFADISDSSAIDADTTFTAADGIDLTLTPTHTSGDTNFLTIDSNQTDDAAATDNFDVMRIKMISESDDAGDTYEGLVISQEAGAANTVIDAAIRIENLENAASTMTDAIKVEATTADAIVDGLDVSDAELTNAINIGANPIAFSTGSLSATDLELLDSGDIDLAAEVTGTLPHENGGLEADVSGYGNGLFGTTGAATVDVDTEAELETALGSLDVVTVTTDDITTANLMTALSDEGAATTYLAGDGTWDDVITEVELDTKAELHTQLTDVTDLAEADGDTYTGTHNFGGAGSVEVPNTASPTVDDTGEVAVDTTDGQVLVHNGTAATVLFAEITKCMIIETPATADNFLFFRAERAITIQGIDCISEDATSTTIEVEECDSNGNTCGVTEAAIACAVTNTTESGGIDDAAVDAGDWMRVDVTAVSGTPGHVNVCVRFTETRT